MWFKNLLQRLVLSFLILCLSITALAKEDNIDAIKKEAYKAFKERQYDDARNKYQQLLEIASDDHRIAGMCYSNLGSIDLIEGFTSRAIGYLEQSLAEYMALGNDTLLAKCQFNQGLAYKRLAQYEKASELLIQSATISERLSLKKELSKAYNVLGNVFRESGNLEQALRYHQQAYELAVALSDSILQAKYLNNKGSTYIEMEYWTEALKDLEGSLAIKQVLKNESAKAFTLFLMGKTYFELENWRKADELFRASKSIHNKFNNKLQAAYCNNFLGKVAVASRRFSEASKYLDSAEVQAKQQKQRDLLLSNYKAQINLHENKGNISKALAYSRLYEQLYEELLNIDKQKAINELTIQYEVKKREDENRLLNQQVEIDRLAIKQKEATIDQWKWRATVISLLIIGSSILGFRFYRLFQKEKAQSEKERQLVEREKKLNKEQHHRIKNNLQAVTGLLSFQLKKLPDSIAKEVIEESKQRIEVIQLLHRQLYVNEEMFSDVIRLDNYLSDLLENVAELFGHIPVSIQSELLPVQLNTNKAIPLGLICNEIITNAFKYSFKDTHDPVLSVQLHQEGGKIHLQISDNSKVKEWKIQEDSIGLELIEGLVKQIGASLERSITNGVVYTLEISNN